MAKKIQYLTVGFRQNEKEYNYKAVIDPDGEIKKPLEENDIVVCQIAAGYGVPVPGSDISYTIGVVIKPNMAKNDIATRFIVQKVNLAESDERVSRESEIQRKKREREELKIELEKKTKRQAAYERLEAAAGDDPDAKAPLSRLKALDAELEGEGEEVNW